LLGGALCFVPVINLFAFGYLVEYAFRLRATREFDLPEWDSFGWGDLFLRGLFFAAIFLGTFALPLFFGWMLSLMLNMMTLGLLGYLSYFPLGLMGFVAPALFLSSLHLYVKDGLFADAWHLRDLLQLAVAAIRQMIIPSLAFWGLMALAWPVYGFAFFLGSWVLIAYSTALFLSLEPERIPSF